MQPETAFPRLIRFALGASLAACGLLYFAFTLRWPLVGDASLIHYIAFLIGRGWAPYRQLGDMNMPGSFLIELAAMHVFGPGALAWRLFDFSLCAGAGVAMFSIVSGFSIVSRFPSAAIPPGLPMASPSIAPRRNWLAGLFATALFVLIHGRDGLAQGGQRDLTMAVCLLGATACLLLGLRFRSVAAAAAFGVLSGIAFTIKPTAALLTVTQGALAARWLRLSGSSDPRSPDPRKAGRYAAAFGLGAVLAPLASVVFLVREHAVGAFFAGLHGLVPYYASLGHRPVGYILGHSLSPIEPLAAVWLGLLVARRGRGYLDIRRQLLLAGVVFGFANCLAQQRALPYYRYPLLGFLLPLMALDLSAAATGVDRNQGSSPSALCRLLAWAGLGFGSFFLAPQSAVLIHRYRWYQTDMLDSLERNLQALGGSRLSGRIQCIDSVSGCNTVLFRMRLEPATGVLSDFLLFGNTTDRQPPEDIPVIRDTRAGFLSVLAANPPKVIVVTSHLHMSGPDEFRKLDRWTLFRQILATRYTLATEWQPIRPERWWSREEYPAGYRIYVLRP